MRLSCSQLDLPSDFRIHPAFHVSKLKPYVSSTNPTAECTNPSPLFTGRQRDYYEVETIVGKKKFGRSWGFLVKWKGWSDDDNSWEALQNVKPYRT
eukprot:jgi/Botrbrau1/14746/Bobra.0108s0089.1